MDELIQEITEKCGVDARLLQDLLQVEQGKVHLERRRGAKNELRSIIEQHLDETKQ